MNTLILLLLAAFALFVYLLPSVYAWHAKHRNAEAIFVVNLFLGWTVLGWIGALVWAAVKSRGPRHSPGTDRY